MVAEDIKTENVLFTIKELTLSGETAIRIMEALRKLEPAIHKELSLLCKEASTYSTKDGKKGKLKDLFEAQEK